MGVSIVNKSYNGLGKHLDISHFLSSRKWSKRKGYMNYKIISLLLNHFYPYTIINLAKKKLKSTNYSA